MYSTDHQWQRAETLGALVNGVFLVALCLSIFLEAIQRFVEPQTVSQPRLVLIVGCFGLLSNILGLFLFHEHGHSHDTHSTAEEGHLHPTAVVADESGNVADVLPQATVATWPKSRSFGKANAASGNRDEVDPTVGAPRQNSTWRDHRRSGSRFSVDELRIHPASFRKEIIAQSRMDDADSIAVDDSESTENTSLLQKDSTHAHEHASEPHSHKDLNMRGVFLHVMGDALGNIGVIGSALFIWLTDYSWRFYADPLISLIITVIILGSAIPLCKAASRILLQAVPAHLSVDEITADIEKFPGVVSCHHLHVWQLSDVKLVASLHVQLEFDFKGDGSARYMGLARSIRQSLHEYGIHSSTIQPEFCLDQKHQHSKAGSLVEPDKADGCLLECGDECGENNQCCAPSTASDDTPAH